MFERIASPQPARSDSAALQRSLALGPCDDASERESDRVADAVMQSQPVAPALAAAAPRVQRAWSDAPLGPMGGARSAFAVAPSYGWNRDEAAVGAIRRIPVEGLNLGNQDRNLRAEAEEAADRRAVVLIPAGLNLTGPVEVLLHFHGHGIGYRQRTTQGRTHASLAPGTVRDIDSDRIEQQLEASQRPMIGVLAQGTTSSGFGHSSSDAYVAEVFRALTGMGIWQRPPAVSRVLLTGHSGGGLPISEMMAEPGQPRLPTTLGGVALFDAINGPNELAAVRTWVRAQLNKDLAALTAPGITPAAQLQYLSTSMRFSGYYTNSEYAARYQSLQADINAWFTQHASALGGPGSATYAALHNNYRTSPAGHGEHEVIMGHGDKLADALSRLPSATAGASAVGNSASAPTIQRRAQHDACAQTYAPSIVEEVVGATGRPLAASTRAFFEPRFGHNFGHVRVHADDRAAAAARAVHAHAFTVGSNIAFGAGMYAPESDRGKRLIAHELTHVVQQGATAANQSRVQRVAWTPTRADERNPAGADRFAAQTFEVTVPSVSGLAGVISTASVAVSIFVPSGAVAARNKIHVFFSPGDATEGGAIPSAVGLNAAMTHGLRGASDATEWILISVPGLSGPRGEQEGFHTIDTAGIQACLRAAGRTSMAIDALRYSAHSRGYRGLRETLNRHLVSGPAPERVVILDAAYGSVQAAIGSAGVPGSRQVAYNVTSGTSLRARGATNIGISPAAARAIGYCRIIADSMTASPAVAVPPAIAAQFLTLPARGSFTTHTPPAAGMININQFARTNAAAISAIIANESGPNGLKAFIDNNNLLKLGTSFPAGIYSHHLFVAEIAHELVD